MIAPYLPTEPQMCGEATWQAAGPAPLQVGVLTIQEDQPPLNDILSTLLDRKQLSWNIQYQRQCSEDAES